MDMPDFKPVAAPTGTARKLIAFGVVAFILLAFAFAYFINIESWR